MTGERMVRLTDVAGIIRSKNSGPYELTLDIIFKTDKDFKAAVAGGDFSKENVARWYGVPVTDVLSVIPYPPAKALKMTLKRPRPSGSLGETDVYGAQQHAPLLNVYIRMAE